MKLKSGHWGVLLKSPKNAELEASVKDENDGLDSADKEEDEDDEEKVDEEGGDEKEKKDDDSVKEDFWDFIKESKHALNEKDLEMVEKYFDREAEKKMNSKIVEYDEGIEDGKMVIEKVDELMMISMSLDLIVSIIALKKKCIVLLLQ